MARQNEDAKRAAPPKFDSGAPSTCSFRRGSRGPRQVEQGSEQPFRIENIGEHPIFSDYRLPNPARGSVHRVAIRSAEPGRNYCSCADPRRSRHLSERDQRRLMIALQRMRMSCDSSYLLDEESDHGTKAGEIITLLGEVFEEPGTKVVIFSQWLRMHEILAQRIAAAGWGHVLFHGGIDSRARAKLVDRFRDDPECRIFLSTDAGGVGLNLQHASVVINVDLPWNPAVLEQRIGRVHRIGQRAPVRVVNFVAEGTIEQGMLSVLRFKKSLFAGVLDGGETEVFLGKGRLDRFMESIERVTAEIQPVPVSEQPSADADVLEPTVPEAGPPALAEPLVDPLTRLLESGVGFLKQLEAALPAETDPGGNGGQSAVRRIEARQDADGSTFLAVPMPSREAVARFTDGLAALLRSMLP